ncbi:Type 1 glutamine amidotransferase-like domain-containing protein [Planococcus halotolerans]|nr:Type 1 glutamine amidotransferase-like domain-containing protein [Planococcus halotolerans]QHJ69385.1 type 1 glutamine amidotransferase-like domain-containing protein [Planococcus halotolerans]
MDHLLLEGLDPAHTKIAYIPSTEDKERKYFNLKAEYYRDYGVREMMFFDLYGEFDSAKINELLQCDIIHLSAGNPMELRQALKRRNMDGHLQVYFEQGGIFAGVSAGAVQFGKSTKLFQLYAGDANETQEALQFVDFEFLPHYNRWNDAFKKQVWDYARTTGTTVYAGNDGDGLIVEDGDIRFIGDITAISGE